jgi:hypothetical protein
MTTIAATMSIACWPCDCCAASARALERAAHVGRHADLGLGVVIARAASRASALGEVERDRRRELGVLVADRGRRRPLAEARDRAQRDERRDGVASALPVDASRSAGLALTRRRRGRRRRAAPRPPPRRGSRPPSPAAGT